MLTRLFSYEFCQNRGHIHTPLTEHMFCVYNTRMKRIDTTLSDDTVRKMTEIALILGLSDRRFIGAVITKAVDMLYQSLKTKGDYEYRSGAKTNI